MFNERKKNSGQQITNQIYLRFFFIPYIHFPKVRIIKILKNISNFFTCTDPRFKEIDIFKDYKR